VLLTFLTIALGTLLSEDLTCIATGLLIQRGEVGISAGILACTSGIFVGDLGLWALGRVFGRAALAWPWLAGRLGEGRVRDARRWLARHAAGAIVASRFLPGTRFALYVMSGVLRLPGSVFALWALVAAVLWTPTIVLLTATLGEVFVRRLTLVLGARWLAKGLTIAALFIVLRCVRTLGSSQWRARVFARFARARRWEFWPTPIFYGPVAAWIAWLAIRRGGLSTMTAANPGMLDGGTVGESKFEILTTLPAEWTIPAIRIRAGSAHGRMLDARQEIESRGWAFPLVVKPDVGLRGVGVRLAQTWQDVADYLARESGAILIQPYHPGPYEAGVFYYRFPDEARGRIFSITDKQFPALVGDGASTVEELIWRHPRYRLQGDTFVARHAKLCAHVLNRGERLALAVAGNHAQGTTFRNGAHLLSPELEQRIDEIARTVPGFFIGRFDVRYRDAAAFMAGRDLAIVELNGATAESTDIYDPDRSLFDAYRILFRQWALVFDIGAANRRAGAAVTPIRRLIALVGAHLTASQAFAISD
jgi:membrane protein DedA with SNARE-associated domain